MSIIAKLKQYYFKEHKGIYYTGIVVFIFLASLLPIFISLGYWLPSLNKILLYENNILVFLLSIFISYILIKQFYQTKLTINKFYILLGLLFFFFFYIKYMYIINFEQNFYSDFRTMWEYALSIYEKGAFIPPDRPQTQRPLASLVPLVLIFGTSTMVFKISNIVFILFSALIVSYLVSQWISKHAAIISFILIMLVPETYFASLIPTHDIPGTFMLLLYMLLTYKFMKNYENISLKNKILYIIFFVLIGLLFEIQRGVLILLFISLFFMFSLFYISGKYDFKKVIYLILIVIVMPMIFIKVSASYMQSQNYLVDSNKMSYIYKYGWSVKNQHTFSNGTGGFGNAFYNSFAKPVSRYGEDELIYFNKSLKLSDIYYNLKERPVNYLERSKRLYSLGTQSRFYYGELLNTSKNQIKTIMKDNKKFNTIYVSLFLIILLISIFKFIFSNKYVKNKEFLYFPLIFISIVSMGLLLAGENQPRYMFMGWFLWIFIIVWFIDDLFTKGDIEEVNNNSFKWSDRRIFVLVGVFFIIYFLFKVLFTFSEYKFRDMSQWTNIECSNKIDSSICKQSIIPFKNNLSDKQYSTLKLQLPTPPEKDEFVKISKFFVADDDKKYIVSLYVMSPYFRKGNSGYFDVNIYINNKLEKTLHISDSKKYRYIRIEDIKPNNNTIKVDFEIKSNISNKSLSWQRASLVYFKFMSIREDFHHE